MPKRFTDCDKWTKNKWFRKLPSNYKLLWLYICDICDPIGIFELDLEMAEILIGPKLKESDMIKYFDGRLEKIGQEKYLIIDFVEFQYGYLSKESRPHQSYINLIKSYGLLKYFNRFIVEKGSSITAKRARLTKTKKDKIIAQDEFRCQYCGEQFERDLLEVDHIIPLVKGGDSEDNNLVTSCVKCNARKKELDVKQFLKNYNIVPLDSLYKKLDSLSIFSDRLKEKEKDKDKEKDKETIISESIYEYYKNKIKAGAATDAVHNIRNLLKLKEITKDKAEICIDNYRSYLDKKEMEVSFYYQANNFFGKKAYWKDWLNNEEYAGSRISF